jgi:hypothetical protein
MAEPIRRTRSETHHPAAGTALPETYAMDVLLIADEPSRTGKRSAGKSKSIEPLDMETVVRKLIAVLHEESES